jgi:hypothetical protein
MNKQSNKRRAVVGFALGFGLGLGAAVANAEIVSDVHIQTDADAVRLDIDSRTYKEIEGFFQGGYPTASVLLHAVSQGMAIDDAVYLATKANVENAAEIYATAAGLLPSLPGWVCHSSATGDSRYHREYPLDDLGPQPTVQAVADRYFNQNQRIAPFPDWQAGGAHMKASVAELAGLLKPEYWYESAPDTTASAKRPVFVSLYKESKDIIVDDNLHQVEKAQQQGVAQLPVVFIYNETKYNPISKYGDNVTLNDVANRYFSGGEQLTAVPQWSDGDHHLNVKMGEFESLFTLPKKEDVDPARWAELENDLKQNGFTKSPVLVTLLSNNRMWLADPARVAVAKELGIKSAPTVAFFHGIDRQACGLSATTCLDRICEAAVAAGADPSVCSEAPAAGGGAAPLSSPPTPPGGGTPSPS